MNRLAVAIDGPAGAGKSTIAKILAKRLKAVYVDTGAMYRAVTVYALQKGFDPLDEKRLAEELSNIHIRLDGEDRVFLNGKDISSDIRSSEVSRLTSPLSAFPAVRAFLVEKQREMSASSPVVMDGRDIGTNVLPDAPVKIFLVASPECRAARRYRELLQRGEKPELGEILQDIRERDARDSSRALNPMVKADDAVEVDTSKMSVEEVVQTLLRIVEQKRGEKG